MSAPLPVSYESRAVVEVPRCQVPPGLVVGSPTRLLDIYSPRPLVAIAPSVESEAQQISVELADGLCAARPRRREVLLGTSRLYSRRTVRAPDSAVIFDARGVGIDNIAHLLQSAVGPILAALDALGATARQDDVIVVVPPGLPPHSHRLLAVLGFQRTIETLGAVAGTILRCQPNEFNCLGSVAAYLRKHAVHLGLVSASGKVGAPVFIKRRKRRTVINMREIEAVAEKAGFMSIFLEDVPTEQQLSIVGEAQAVMACHGAGMSYTYFRDPSVRGATVELFSCGFATSWARTNAWVVNDAWVGLQGRLEGSVINRLYGRIHGHTFEARNFLIDPASCQLAISVARKLAAGAVLGEILELGVPPAIALSASGVR